jgi:2-polyprenyl-3-methyl-5-hydroxy-6-metoxy-1,4-benzoquinol methylase
MKYPEFYEKIFAPRHGIVPTDALGRLRRKLEAERQETVYKLLDGGERLLDVGCGYGYLMFMATQKYREVHGLDMSESRIKWDREAAANLEGASIDFKMSDANRGIPYEDGYFDAVTCVASLQFLVDPYYIIGEFNRVLKQGGVLVIQVVNIAFVPRRLILLAGRFPVTARAPGWDGGTLHYFTFTSCDRLLFEKGFIVVAKTNSGILAGWRRFWPSLLAADIIIKGIKK